MFHVVLYQPEIPPNTGNIIRLCSNSGTHLHLIEPLGFDMDDSRLRRAGLDYHEWASIRQHKTLERFISDVRPARLLAFSTRAVTLYTDVGYRKNDAFLFGPETRGLPREILERLQDHEKFRLPMHGPGRSLNLSNCVAVVVYEAWRQQGFTGSDIRE